MERKTTWSSPSTELSWQQGCGIGRTCFSEKIPSFSLQPFCSIQIIRDWDIRSQIFLLKQKSNFVTPIFVRSFLNISFWPYLQNTWQYLVTICDQHWAWVWSCSILLLSKHLHCSVAYCLSLHSLWSQAACLGWTCPAWHSGTLPQDRYFLISIEALSAYKGCHHNCVTPSKCVNWGKSIPDYGLKLVSFPILVFQCPFQHQHNHPHLVPSWRC